MTTKPYSKPSHQSSSSSKVQFPLSSKQGCERVIQNQQILCTEMENDIEAFMDQYPGELSPGMNFYTLIDALSDLLTRIREKVYRIECLEDERISAEHADKN